MAKANINAPLKTAIYFIVISVVAYSFYTLYSQTQMQAETISLLSQQLSEKSQIIGSLNANLESLNLALDSMKSELKAKDFIIDNLRTKLGITEGEVQELTPVVKNYFAAGVRGKNGVMIPLETKMAKGTGVVSVNIKNVELQSGAQDSIRLASQVAQEYTNIALSEKDITVTFVNEEGGLVSLDGPSAGAAITLTIIAAVLNKTPDAKILITGTIESDGTVGSVGSIKEKATAAATSGAKIFLVPFGQKVEVGGIEVAEVKKIQEVVNLVLK